MLYFGGDKEYRVGGDVVELLSDVRCQMTDVGCVMSAFLSFRVTTKYIWNKECMTQRDFIGSCAG